MEVITMAIEPLGSVMSYQAQTVQPATPKVAAAKPAAEFTEGAALNHSVVIDANTPVVSQIAEQDAHYTYSTGYDCRLCGMDFYEYLFHTLCNTCY